MGTGDSGSRSDRGVRRGRPSRGLQVAVVDADGCPVKAGGLALWLTRIAPARASGTVSVALVADARVRRLNRIYRAKDYATDVLSFPFEPSTPASHLGDIVIATGVAARQARSAGHSTYTELRVLALHGLLHLIGYDHETDKGTMERFERRLRRQGGLSEGLIERGGVDRGRKNTKRARPGEGPRRQPASGVERAIGPRVTKRARPGEGPRRQPASGVERAIGPRVTKRARPGEGPRSKK